tara:strand:+ start:23 stop:232 length:210 start_codon:yes stop_codon:yes gene_type:complete
MLADKIKTIVKGTHLKVNNGIGLCNAYSMESIKQGRGFKKILLVDLKGSEVGFFDECGSIYVSAIKEVL